MASSKRRRYGTTNRRPLMMMMGTAAGSWCVRSSRAPPEPLLRARTHVLPLPRPRHGTACVRAVGVSSGDTFRGGRFTVKFKIGRGRRLGRTAGAAAAVDGRWRGGEACAIRSRRRVIIGSRARAPRERCRFFFFFDRPSFYPLYEFASHRAPVWAYSHRTYAREFS